MRNSFFLYAVTIVFLLLIILLIVINDSDNRSEQDIWFLIIGVGQYANTEYGSKYGAHDAQVLAEELLFIYGNKRIILLSEANATKRNILFAITDWLEKQEVSDSTVVIYCSSHGSTDYIYPYDSIEYSNKNNISVHEFNDALEKLDSENIILLFDTCYSYDYASRLINDNRIVVSCCSEDQVCWESENLMHGIFSSFLIQAIRNLREKNGNEDNILTIFELYTYIEKSMQTYYSEENPPSEQSPRLIMPLNMQDSPFITLK